MRADLEALESAAGYRFTNRELLCRALTHSSHVHEQTLPPGSVALRDNEQLEFLGDSVLGFLVSEGLVRLHPEAAEGRLSKLKANLVSAAWLYQAAVRLELGEYLHLGRGEETAGGRSKQRLLVNAFEAVLAAVYLDGGAEAARGVLLKHAMPDEEELGKLAGAGPPHDFRAELERLSRDRNLPRPQYQLLGEAGPGHARTFRVEVRIGREIAVAGEGPSKKAAAHQAAQEVCRILRDTLPEP